MDFFCPKCAKILSVKKDAYCCVSCDFSWPIKDGVPVFSDDIYWGELSQEKMRQINDFVKDNDWAKSKNFIKQNHNITYRFSFDPGRADWRFLMPLKADWRVLDAGCGTGGNTFALANHVAEVVAFDVSFDRANFVFLRAKSEQINNINAFVGSIFSLPLKKNDFNLIIMNGVLEWVGTADKAKDPYEAQTQSLKACHDLLKEDGYLYIGIENRYSIVYLIGGVDHSGLKYTSWMPRFFANLCTKLKKDKRYDTYTHGKKSLERLLKKAGFMDVKFYLSLSGYNFPQYLIPYDDLGALKYVLLNLMSERSFGKKAVKLLINIPFVLRLYRNFSFSFSVIAKK